MPVLASAADAPLIVLIQPNQGEEETRQVFKPLLNYLEKATDTRFTLLVRSNFLSHWETVRRNKGYDLVFDDAHFTDYRVQKFGFRLLAKISGTTSYSVVIPGNQRTYDPFELAGKKIASFGPPSIGVARLNALFPNPARRPAIIEVSTTREALALLAQNKVHAAILPTTSVSANVARGDVRLLTTTEPTPSMALSASPRVSATLLTKIRSALFFAPQSEEGRRMLQQINVERFEPATPETYAGQRRILKEYWGY